MAPASIHAVGMRVGCGLGGDSPCHGHRRRHPPGSAGGSPGGPHAPSALQSHPKHRRAARSPAVPARVARAQSTRLTPASGPGPGTICTADPSRGHRPEREGPRPGQRRAQQDTASRFSRRDPNATSSRDRSQGPGQNGAHSAWVSTRTHATRQRPGHCSIGRLAHSHPLTRPLAQTHTLMHTHARSLTHTHTHTHSLTNALAHTHAHTHSLTQSCTHTPAHSHSHPLTHTCSHSYLLTHSLTLSTPPHTLPPVPPAGRRQAGSTGPCTRASPPSRGLFGPGSRPTCPWPALTPPRSFLGHSSVIPFTPPKALWTHFIS